MPGVLPPARHAQLTAAMIDSRPAIPAAIREPGVVAIARRLDPTAVAPTCDGLLRGGIRALEMTLNEPEDSALEALGVAVRHAAGTDLCIGAGTVLSIEAARRAIDAGAAFLVSPHLDAELVAWAAGQGVAMLPGAATPTEVLAAWRAGAAGVKVFPASSLGPTFIRELTPTLLTQDTRVTNHGYKNGKATPHQSILQKGTAVLVDSQPPPQPVPAPAQAVNVRP